MKTVFIVGSRKFYDKVQNLAKELKVNNICALTAGKWDKLKKDTLAKEKVALLNAFRIIDESDIVYIVSDEGYVGKSGAMEIAYAYAKKKELISSENIGELSARALISKVMNSNKLINHCKSRK